ncbi:ECF RNA polymerase sigma factor SigW [bioreactor metagenome]|jgi:RNA polymerase sigma-70 factor (ECF subfamily)|uniref:RNA polymerase RpoE-like sigma-24 subunit n=2 Tax=root TaxID=1 RepID=A0A562JBF4_9FIRM|nr:sigma-70 family RNA polymerase sigma factor [Sedimentibacter saalensis]MEA5093977.1 sigma-70 family RNA polymerase sigma factor [Sedimentibacter saalensis]TWH80522.1 RNA polymerase RpoE-like sigma-24 subunit [Sedimentibacter saalensis]
MKGNELWLVEQSRNGDVDAFEELIKDYKKVAYNIALRVLRNVEDAEDASQEALIKVYKSIQNFNMQSSFKSWMYRIVVNTCIDFKRKKNINAVSIDENIDLGGNKEFQIEIADDTNNPDILIEKNFNSKLISDAVGRLEDDFKTIIILRDIQGFSYSEISEMLNCNLGTVKSRLNRARKSLKEILENELNIQS